ncbi:zeta toxin family protein, partial [Lysobacter sp. 2RAB21]
MQSHGYEVEVRAVAAHKLESELGVDGRFGASLDESGYGRYVPEGARTAIYGKLPVSLDIVHAQTTAPIRIFNREGEELYDSRTNTRTPGAVLEEAREARLKNPRVMQQLVEGWQQQETWHEKLPDAIKLNDKVSPDTAVRVVQERTELKVQEGVVERSRGVQQQWQQSFPDIARTGIGLNPESVDLAKPQILSRANEAAALNSAENIVEHAPR